jgi:hypothetical protein
MDSCEVSSSISQHDGHLVRLAGVEEVQCGCNTQEGIVTSMIAYLHRGGR